jgi:hypothetical protein
MAKSAEERAKDYFLELMKKKGFPITDCSIEKLKSAPPIKKHVLYWLNDYGTDSEGVGVLVTPSLLSSNEVLDLTSNDQNDLTEFVVEEKVHLGSEAEVMEYAKYFLAEIFPQRRNSVRLISSVDDIDKFDLSIASRKEIKAKAEKYKNQISKPSIEKRGERYHLVIYGWAGGTNGKLLRFEMLITEQGYFIDRQRIIIGPKWGSWDAPYE